MSAMQDAQEYLTQILRILPDEEEDAMEQSLIETALGNTSVADNDRVCAALAYMRIWGVVGYRFFSWWRMVPIDDPEPVAIRGNPYHESLMLIYKAERLRDRQRAQELFREAAELQRQMVAELPADRTKTRSVFGLSVASLLYKGGDLEGSESYARDLLVQPWVEPRSAEKLRDLLHAIAILTVIAGDPLTVREIAPRSGLTLSEVTRQLKELEREGRVTAEGKTSGKRWRRKESGNA